jgi:discoidin domain receptor family protein 2
MSLGGLGQLTDGIIAQDDYRVTDNVQGIGQIGYDWIGWKRKSSAVNLIFQFDTIRNFTSVRFHISNLFTRGVYLFRSITITDCEETNHRTHLVIPNDSVNTNARFIRVFLEDKNSFISKCLNVIITFNNRSQWILISEVQFDFTTPININISESIGKT